MKTKSPITTHVLDVSRGQPAAGIAVRLEQVDAAGVCRTMGHGVTDADGRLADLMQPEDFAPGSYRVTFATGPYFAAQGTATFYPQVVVEFTVVSTAQHYHVPLLLSPFGYSTYRGS